MTRMRPACARMPVEAIAIDLMKSIMAILPKLPLSNFTRRRPAYLSTAILISERLRV